MAATYIVTDGDSITFGNGASSHFAAYPFQLALLLCFDRMVGVSNTGTPGNRVSDLIIAAPSMVDAQFDVRKGRNFLVFLGGINDFYALTGILADATTVYNRIVSYCQARKAAGFTVIVQTILPCSSATPPANLEANRQALNANIRANWATFAEGLSDIGNDPNMGQAGQETGAYYSGDHVHPSDAGYAVIAGYVRLALNRLGVN